MITHDLTDHFPVAGYDDETVVLVEHVMCFAIDLLIHTQDRRLKVVVANKQVVRRLANTVGLEKFTVYLASNLHWQLFEGR